ncbi:hypothetical protein OG453_38330 [Streptomyces sp. NBC_01381]|uniref:hypothetical protein n=1 Tax=Streptomyces sp. NBC_01381 TaxID=2903845 RepID=UPI00224EDB2E|nr:hypothetical protein [Streptomyces sp. NBC_01381]MCX4672447.1 hypothetical protein [Streptomyces sp. NBC_01381]
MRHRQSDLSNDTTLRKAILRYNHVGWYADKVLGFIRQYDQLAPSTRTGKNVGTTPATTGYWTQFDWAIRRVV